MAHILIIEDERDTQAMIGEFLGRAGHDVATADNGWEALLKLGDQKFDLVVLDMMLPGLDGGKFLKILRRSTRDGNLPVVIVTALDRSVAEERSAGGDVDAIVIKRQNFLKELAAAVRGVVGGSPDGETPLHA